MSKKWGKKSDFCYFDLTFRDDSLCIVRESDFLVLLGIEMNEIFRGAEDVTGLSEVPAQVNEMNRVQRSAFDLKLRINGYSSTPFIVKPREGFYVIIKAACKRMGYPVTDSLTAKVAAAINSKKKDKLDCF